MNPWKPLLAGVAAMAFATAVFAPTHAARRGVRRFDDAAATAAWDREQSTGLFIGVRRFDDDQITEVPYAVDDAIDLAYMFALDRHVRLVPPRRVVLLISGLPEKRETQRRLDDLIAAGAIVTRTATKTEIVRVLEQQVVAAGANGLLVVSLATHGFAQAGTPYVLGSTSKFRDPETALSTDYLLDLIAQVPRSLVFIDACRERIDRTTRSAGADPRASSPASRMASIAGQATFYAAAAGRLAYDDGGNGVFTRAILDGLSCGASADRGYVTVDTLRTFIGHRVRNWIRENRHASIAPATQTCVDDAAENMPLSLCPGPR